jgi:four helix bundle protein
MYTYSFENLRAWKENRVLVKLIYDVTRKFPKEESYGLTQQIRKAIVSVASNIAEGSGRRTAADQRHFYTMAYSSLMEVLNQLILAFDLEYLSENDLLKCRLQINESAKWISSLAKSTDKFSHKP